MDHQHGAVTRPPVAWTVVVQHDLVTVADRHTMLVRSVARPPARQIRRGDRLRVRTF
jgi:hypothetical protein